MTPQAKRTVRALLSQPDTSGMTPLSPAARHEVLIRLAEAGFFDPPVKWRRLRALLARVRGALDGALRGWRGEL